MISPLENNQAVPPLLSTLTVRHSNPDIILCQFRNTHTPGEMNGFIDAYLDEIKKEEQNIETTFTGEKMVYELNHRVMTK